MAARQVLKGPLTGVLLGALVMVAAGFGTARSTYGSSVRDDPLVTWKTSKPVILVACLDVTASVSPKVLVDGRKLLARMIASEPKRGSGRYIAFVRTISSNSIDPSNNRLTVDLPEVPQPSMQALVFPTTKRRQDQERQYKAALAQEKTKLASAMTKARVYARKALGLKAVVDDKGTDLEDCPAAAQRLYLPGYYTQLLIVSDLLPSNAPKGVLFHLPGTAVTIFQYCHINEADCTRRQATFTGRLHKAGAGAINVHTVELMSVCRDPFAGC